MAGLPAAVIFSGVGAKNKFCIGTSFVTLVLRDLPVEIREIVSDIGSMGAFH